MKEVLDYSRFKEEMKLKIMGFLPDDYRGKRAELISVPKINGPRDALIICGNGMGVSPNIYLDDLYKEYIRDFNIDRILKSAAKYYTDNIVYARKTFESSRFTAPKQLKDQIAMILINPEKTENS